MLWVWLTWVGIAIAVSHHNWLQAGEIEIEEGGAIGGTLQSLQYYLCDRGLPVYYPSQEGMWVWSNTLYMTASWGKPGCYSNVFCVQFQFI